jgi:hypothetical protein
LGGSDSADQADTTKQDQQLTSIMIEKAEGEPSAFFFVGARRINQCL